MSDFTDGELVVLLKGLYEIKRQRDDLDKAYKKASLPVRDWLEQHPGENLRDGEAGIVAHLQERQGPQEADFIRMAEKVPELIVRLALLGCVKLDATAFKGSVQGKRREGDEAAPFLMPGKGSIALLIDKERE